LRSQKKIVQLPILIEPATTVTHPSWPFIGWPTAKKANEIAKIQVNPTKSHLFF
jgi:hypothetical protein